MLWVWISFTIDSGSSLAVVINTHHSKGIKLLLMQLTYFVIIIWFLFFNFIPKTIAIYLFFFFLFLDHVPDNLYQVIFLKRAAEFWLLIGGILS